MPDETSGFDIEGKTYPVPTLDTFDMDEAQVLYDYAGLGLEDFGPAHPEATDEEKEANEQEILQKAKNPAFKKALLHVAYARGNPELTSAQVKAAVGKVNILQATLALLAGDDSPPEMTDSQSEPESNSVSKPPSLPTDSGSPSPNGSEGLVALPGRIGTTESATSSRPSLLTG